MSNPVWQGQYPKGVSQTINLDQYSSLIALMEESFEKFADKESFYCMGVCLTYRELDMQSRQFASFLQNHTDLKPGDRIAIQMPNLIQYPIALFGALRAGMVVVNTNPLYTAREMEHQFTDANVKALVVLANFADKLQAILPKTEIRTVIITEIGDMMPFPKRQIVNFAVKYIKKMVPPYSLPQALSFREVLAKGKDKPFQRVEVDKESNAFIQYTGGTTGVAKGAELSHRNMLANMLQIQAWMCIRANEGKETIITALPMYHIFCLTVNCFAFTAFGAKNILITNPRDMPAFIEELKKHKFTALTGVNTLFNGLLNQPNIGEVDFSHLKLAVGGGMAVQKAVAERWQEATGCPLVEGYGLTEASPVLCCNPVDGTERIGTIGLPMPSTEIMIADDDGNPVAQGERGELWGRGPQVMRGYWKRPEATEGVLTPDGWLKTGDIAVMTEDGFFKIVDRKKDMILVSGFNVYPNEVEDTIALHPKVLEVAVIGVSDEKSGEAVKAVIVAKDPSLTKEELKEHCKEHLTGYKQPRHYAFIAAEKMPKTNVGKILRRELKEMDKAGNL
ncbi:MAG: AMP-binding protein [Bernardetiaceae bacterium]